MKTSFIRWWRTLRGDRARFSLAIGFAMVGLLFWARLIVIADMPRTAIAEPELAAPVETRKSGATDKDEDAALAPEIPSIVVAESPSTD